MSNKDLSETDADHSSPSSLTAAPTLIRELRIERFRGIASLKWKPSAGVNVVLGGGDVGKTTILDAIALLFSPTNSATLSDTDYHGRNIDAEFSIEADVSLSESTAIDNQAKHSWPWVWDGDKAIAPALDTENSSSLPTVYRLRVRGTSDLELFYEIIQPDGAADPLSVTLRRSIGLVRLGGDDRRLAALTIAEENHGEAPITVVDEIERGLEPYRQRALIQRLQADPCQSFITTHSPTVISVADSASLWYVDAKGRIGSLDSKKIGIHRKEDPESFLSRLTIVGEGITEVGFARAHLERHLESSLLTHGGSYQ